MRVLVAGGRRCIATVGLVAAGLVGVGGAAPPAEAALPTSPVASVRDASSPLTVHFEPGPLADPARTLARDSIDFGDGTTYDCSTPCAFNHPYGTGGEYTVTLTDYYTTGAPTTASVVIPVGVDAALQGNQTPYGSASIDFKVGAALGRQVSIGLTRAGRVKVGWQASAAGSIGVVAPTYNKIKLLNLRAVVGDAQANVELKTWGAAAVTSTGNDTPLRQAVISGAPLVMAALPVGSEGGAPMVAAGAGALQGLAANLGLPQAVGLDAVDTVSSGIGLTVTGSAAAKAGFELTGGSASTEGSGQEEPGTPLAALNLAGLSLQAAIAAQVDTAASGAFTFSLQETGQATGTGPNLSIAKLVSAGYTTPGSFLSGVRYAVTVNPDGTSTCSGALSTATSYASVATTTLTIPCGALANYASLAKLNAVATQLQKADLPSAVAQLSLSAIAVELANAIVSAGAPGATLEQTVTTNSGTGTIDLGAQFTILGVGAAAGVKLNANLATTWTRWRIAYLPGPGATGVPVLAYSAPGNLTGPTSNQVISAYAAYVATAATAAGQQVVTTLRQAATSASVQAVQTAQHVVSWPFRATAYWLGFGPARRAGALGAAPAPGIDVTFAAGSAPDPTGATWNEVMPGVEPATGPEVSEGLTAIGPIYDAEPAAPLGAPATVAITYPASLLGGIDPATLAVWRHDEGGWVKLPGTVVDAANDTVSGQTTSLGTFAVGVDTTAPTISGEFPQAGDLVGSSTFEADIEVADPTTPENALNVAGTIDGSPVTWAAVADDSWAAEVGPLADGPHVLTVTSSGQDGVASTASFPFTVNTRVPLPPTDFAASADPAGGVDLSWGAPTDGTGRIWVDRSDGSGVDEYLGDFAPDAGQVTDATAPAGQPLTYTAYSQTDALVDSSPISVEVAPNPALPEGRPWLLALAGLGLTGLALRASRGGGRRGPGRRWLRAAGRP